MPTSTVTGLTPEQYLEIERAAESRSEYLDGEMLEMPGATVSHNSIVTNLAWALHDQLERKRCRYFTSDLRLLVPATGFYTYPDLMVICGEIEFSGNEEDIVTNPRVIVEVLSETTVDYDRGLKYLHYRSLSSLMDYVIVAQDSPLVEHNSRRNDGSWLLREYKLLDDVVQIDSISAALGLSAIYDDVFSELKVNERNRQI